MSPLKNLKRNMNNRCRFTDVETHCKVMLRIANFCTQQRTEMLKLNNYDYESSAKQIATSDEKFFSDCQLINGLSVDFIFAKSREALW